MTDHDIPHTDYSQNTDENLAERCKSLDEYAFQELTRRYIKPIFNFVRRYTQSEEVAEDITQDTFFKVWKNVRQYKRGMKFRSWLYTIARNTSLDYIKKKKAASFSDLDDNANDLVFSDTLQDTEPLQAEIFDNVVMTETLSKTIRLLHPDHQTVITLHYQEELTFDEISKVLNRPMNTVKSWHRRALIHLRQLLKDDTSI
ncbi:MAG: RNA polymerase sigma factor [Candidatus Taylorbacteria bacterium]